MLIKLLQSFDAFELDLVSQPSDSLAPEGWRSMPNRQAVERLFPKCHLTMYLHVSVPSISREENVTKVCLKFSEGHVDSHA